jgi:hypothetical protein
MITYDGKNRRTVNYLKCVYFDHPEWTPCAVGLMAATWMKYRRDLEALVLAYPKVFPGFRAGSRDYDAVNKPADDLGRHTDCWGCVWENIERGLAGQVVGHPLSDWAALASYRPPDPMTEDLFGPRRDWEAVRRDLAAARSRGDLAAGGGLPHGFFYMQLYYLRGFENLMLDMAADEPRLRELIALVEGHNLAVIRKYLELGAELMSFGDDLGLQRSLPMSPEMWRRYVKPSYERMLAPCREAGACIYLHTDGHVLPIIGDLIEVGVTVLNPQIRANGLEGLQRLAKGKVAINQDLDRQLFPFASRSQVADHIAEVFEGLHLPEGGLMLYAECEPDVPLDTIDAICRTLETLCDPPDPADVDARPAGD